MQIAKPQVHLRLDTVSENYMIHVVTWMDQTKFIADGYESLPTVAVSGVYPITLRIKENAQTPNMALLTPVVHTLVLEGIDLDLEPFIQVTLINASDSNASVVKRKNLQNH